MNVDRIAKILEAMSDSDIAKLYSMVWDEKTKRDTRVALSFTPATVTGDKIGDIKTFRAKHGTSLNVARLAVEHAYTSIPEWRSWYDMRDTQ